MNIPTYPYLWMSRVEDLELVKKAFDGPGIRWQTGPALERHKRNDDQPLYLYIHIDDLEQAADLIRPSDRRAIIVEPKGSKDDNLNRPMVYNPDYDKRPVTEADMLFDFIVEAHLLVKLLDWSDPETTMAKYLDEVAGSAEYNTSIAMHRKAIEDSLEKGEPAVFPCPHCKGTGTKRGADCEACNGEGTMVLKAACTKGIETFLIYVEMVVKVIEDVCELDGVMVTDESRIDNFPVDDSKLEEISSELGFKVSTNDRVLDLAKKLAAENPGFFGETEEEQA